MSEYRFVLVDFTHMNRAGCLRLYEARQRPPGWVPPNMFQLLKVLTEAEVIEAEAELKALQRHALEVIDPETES
ncbi:MAG: hypothetical protein WA322_00380 [Pseudolabrys sp.]